MIVCFWVRNATEESINLQNSKYFRFLKDSKPSSYPISIRYFLLFWHFLGQCGVGWTMSQQLPQRWVIDSSDSKACQAWDTYYHCLGVYFSCNYLRNLIGKQSNEKECRKAILWSVVRCFVGNKAQEGFILIFREIVMVDWRIGPIFVLVFIPISIRK